MRGSTDAGASAMRGSTNGQARRRARRIVMVLIALLYVISVPWYRATGDPVEVVAGLPDWVALALACYVAVAVLNAVAWWLTEVPDAEPPEVDSAFS